MYRVDRCQRRLGGVAFVFRFFSALSTLFEALQGSISLFFNCTLSFTILRLHILTLYRLANAPIPTGSRQFISFVKKKLPCVHILTHQLIDHNYGNSSIYRTKNKSQSHSIQMPLAVLPPLIKHWVYEAGAGAGPNRFLPQAYRLTVTGHISLWYDATRTRASPTSRNKKPADATLLHFLLL